MIKRMNRESNYELLRIIAMFFIVLWHVIQHSYLIENTPLGGVNNFLINAIMFFIVIHVNLFLLITGYYQSKSKFKLKKLISLIFLIGFYNVLINSIFKFCGLMKYSNLDYLLKISFFNLDTYWYLKCYIIVFLLSPFFNLLIEKMNKKIYKRLLISLILAFSIIPFLTGNLFYEADGLSQQILLYFVGAYIRKYNLNKNLFSTLNITQKRLLYLGSFLIFWIINISMYTVQIYLTSLNSDILKYIGSCLGAYKCFYNNPIVILQSLSIFLLFGTFKVKSKIINRISSLTLGIYLIHEMRCVYSHVYKWIGLDKGKIIYDKQIILKAIFWAVIIFIVCALIEYLRQLIVKFLFKIKTIDKKYNNFIDYLHRVFEIKNNSIS